MMKKMILLSILIFCSMVVFAPIAPVIFIGAIKPIIITDMKIKAHELFESKGDSLAYKSDEDAAGILQTRIIMLEEVNRICRIKGLPYVFKPEDRYDPGLSRKMWYIAQNYWNPDYDLTLASRLWNSGTIKELKSEKYRKKVEVYCDNVNQIYNRLCQRL